MTAPEFPADMIERVARTLYWDDELSQVPVKRVMWAEEDEALRCDYRSKARGTLAAAFPDGPPRPEAEVKAEAWDEGYRALRHFTSFNPYRADAIEGADR